MTCARCHGKPRKNFAILAVQINVVVNYQTKERRTLEPSQALCTRCQHSLQSLYGGNSQGSLIKLSTDHKYIRESDGQRIFQ
jgi:hypothetical protein